MNVEKSTNALKNISRIRKTLRRKREIIIAEALGEYPPSEIDSSDDIEEEDDYEFFLRCDKISFNKETKKFKIEFENELIEDDLLEDFNEE